MCGAFVLVNTGIHIPRGVDISRVRFSLPLFWDRFSCSSNFATSSRVDELWASLLLSDAGGWADRGTPHMLLIVINVDSGDQASYKHLTT